MFIKADGGSGVEDDGNIPDEKLSVGVADPQFWLCNIAHDGNNFVAKVWLLVSKRFEKLKQKGRKFVKWWNAIFQWRQRDFTLNGNPINTTTWSITSGRVTYIFVCNLTIIGSNNVLSPDRRQAIIWTNAGILLIGPFGTSFSEIVIEMLTFSFKKMRLKVLSAKLR